MKRTLRLLTLVFAVCLVGLIAKGTASANAGDDTLRTATTIVKQGTVSGIINGRYDEDFYSYTAPSNGLLTVKMSNDGYMKDIEIIDENGEISFASFTTDNELLGDASRRVGLKKGQKIFIKIESFNGLDVEYKLNLSFREGNNYEKENNNTIRVANSISATSKTIGELQRSSDEDYFKFTLKSAGNVKLKMNNAGESKTIRLFNSKQEQLVTITTDDDKVGSASRNIGLAKGTYYIKIDSHSSMFVPYVLHLKYTKSNYYEKEINNTLRTANLMIFNKSYRGVLEADYDNDYFKFKVTKKKSMTIYLNNSGDRKTISLYNSKGQEISYFSTNPDFNGNSYLKATLGIGTYYMKVLSYYGTNEPYTVRVK